MRVGNNVFKGWIRLGSHRTSFGIFPNFDVDILSASHAFLGVTPGRHHPVLVENHAAPSLLAQEGAIVGLPTVWTRRGMFPAGDLLWAPCATLGLGVSIWGVTEQSSALPEDWGPHTVHTKGPPTWRALQSPDWPSLHHTCPCPTFPASDPAGPGWWLGVCTVKVCQIKEDWLPFP